jgi:hypothetical protein
MEGVLLIGIVLFVALSLAGGMGATSSVAGGGYGSSPQGSGSGSGAGNGYCGSSSQSPSGGGSYGGSGGGGSSAGDVGGSDADILARTIYGEARGSGVAAMQGVASVVVNRYQAGFPGGSIAGVCRAPYQFSCWNSNDPNLSVIQSVTASNSIFAQCLQIAQMAVTGSLPDNTGGATYYHDTSIATPRSWGNVVETTQIATLIFFKPAGYV